LAQDAATKTMDTALNSSNDLCANASKNTSGKAEAVPLSGAVTT
jgi:hypothetical protein